MSALGFLAASSMLAGGLPPLWGRRKRPRKPDPVAQARAAAKRARKAAKRAEDAARTEWGRGWARLKGGRHTLPTWDRIERMHYHSATPRQWAGGGAVKIDGVVHQVTFVEPSVAFFLPASEPRWRQRLHARRTRPMSDERTLYARLWRLARAAGKPWFMGRDHGHGRTATGRKQHRHDRFDAEQYW